MAEPTRPVWPGDLLLKVEKAPPRKRLDLDGRDPDTLTPIEKLAHVYPDVYTLMKQLEDEEAAHESMRRTITTQAAAIARVRQLHPREALGERVVCGRCTQSDETEWPWPCPTIEALDEPDRPESR